ncbi:6-phosphogluconolactonase [Floricoccus tropicus]|uniref:6-phosphogluconolactonase n=1 Tax=Floricoccus tropicus TaxID=1859473 RepID=A0A1E8GRZ6_9LACT|nr:lactonase family protein [Floricoccus tropicus]OFI50393.1 6-phosphogluconolactonase [Floricoccus tropicus]
MQDTIYFGTYTRRESKGIYKATLDTETGQLSDLIEYIEEPSPTYLTIDDQKHLYSVGAVKSEGGVAAFDANGHLLNHVVEEGAPLCYVSVDEERDLVYGANYHKGQVLAYRRQEDGSLSLSDKVQHVGFGPHENQSSPHVHFADLTPDKFLVTCDLGTDSVTTYDILDGKLIEINNYQSAPGSGARHIVFQKTNKIAYLICELNSTIEVLIYDGVGEFSLLQTISTLPEDYVGFNGTAAIRLSADDKFLYASNRGHDSIVVYKCLGDSTLEKIQTISTSGKTPRDINLSSDGKIVAAAHQDSDNVTTFSRDEATGLLTEIQHDFKVPEAVCVYVEK